MKVLIINGPNLNLLGKREPHIYGTQTFEDYLLLLKHQYPAVEIQYFQSNHEGELIDALQKAGFDESFTGIILNGGAYSHSSIAIADAIGAIKTVVVEVHISNIYARETFRHHSWLSEKCVGVIVGLGLTGYKLAIEYLIIN